MPRRAHLIADLGFELYQMRFTTLRLEVCDDGGSRGVGSQPGERAAKMPKLIRAGIDAESGSFHIGVGSRNSIGQRI